MCHHGIKRQFDRYSQLELRLESLEHNNQQKSIRDRLIASEARLRCILDTMADGVCIVDENGTTTYINQMADHITTRFG